MLSSRLLVLSTKEKVIEMSGGDQLSENQSSVSDTGVNSTQSDIAAMIRAVFDECMKNPHEFVENERIQRGE